MIEPLIKWTGSKRSQASEIISHFPKKIGTYYEPFCGGCSVAFMLMTKNLTDLMVHRFVLSDANESLVQILNIVRENPDSLVAYYTMMWEALKKIDGIEGKKEFYEKLRDKYNEGKDPYDFMVIDRLCYNGMIRFNSKGEFNSPFHLNRDGIRPDKFAKIVKLWHDLFDTHRNRLEIMCQDYSSIQPSENDFVYMDPPYANSKTLYNGGFDSARFFDFVRNQKCQYALSYDGISGETDSTVDIPKDLYTTHLYITSGNSSFKRIKKIDSGAIVKESLYIKSFE